MASANDMKAAQQTYDSFISVVKYCIPVIVLIVALVIVLLAS